MIYFSGAIDPSSIVDKLIPSGIWPFIIQIISTLVMLFIIKKYFYSPIKSIFDKRANYVLNALESAKTREKNSIEIEKQLLSEKVKVQTSLKELQNQVLEEIELNKNKILNDAQEQALRIKQKTADEISKAKQQVILDLEKEMINVALDASKKVLQREFNNTDNSKIVEDFIKGLRN
jgi:F-type H+-transporting ATPase subunit b